MYGGENQFKNLPSRFGQLYQLQELDVSGCELEALPESLSHCVSIVRLWLSNNRYRQCMGLSICGNNSVNYLISQFLCYAYTPSTFFSLSLSPMYVCVDYTHSQCTWETYNS